MKLRILCQEVMADFIQHSKASINIEPAIASITITYQEALTSFWNQVNIKYPPEVSFSRNRKRIVRKLGYTRSGCGCGG